MASSELQQPDDGEGVENLFKRLRSSATRACEAKLHTGSDYHYYQSFPDYKQATETASSRVHSLLKQAQALTKTRNTPEEPLDWGDAELVQEWVGIVLDDTMEGVDSALDAHRRGGVAVVQQLPSSLATGATIAKRNEAVDKAAKKKGLVRTVMDLARPQDTFDPPVNNSKPFVHWAVHLRGLADEGSEAAAISSASPGSAVHPLQGKLEQLQYQPWQLDTPEPQAPRLLEDTPLEWVDTEVKLAAMVDELSQEQHIAIDLENHSFRSFHGFTCLMQLSSRTKDYVVDVLALRSAVGPALAPLFANPSVVKVLHGSDHDVLWLQRDYHLYLVNMFDTGQAARVLSLPSHGLAYLLEHYCSFTADKRFQLADWRVRPLSPEMLHYARCDTHFLLYVYDRLKQQLAALSEPPPSLQVAIAPGRPRGPLGLVLERSRLLCLELYACEPLVPAFPHPCEQADEMLRRAEVPFSRLQRAVFSALFAWRDGVCREEDEGVGYVMPKAALLNLAQNMPESEKDVTRLLGRNVSEVVKRRASEVVGVIKRAKEHVLTGPPQAQPQAAAATAASAPAAAVMNSVAHAAPAAVATPVMVKAVAAIKVKARGMLGGGRAAAAKPAARVTETVTGGDGAADDSGAQPAVSALGKRASSAAQGDPGDAAADEVGGPGAGNEQVKRLKASFQLPFAVMQQADAVGAEGQAARTGQGQADEDPEEEGEEQEEVEDEQAQRPTTGQDVRDAINAMRAEAGGEAEAAPGDGDEDAAAAENGQADTLMARRAAGKDAGLPVLEYIPLSLKEMKRQTRNKQPARGGGAGSGSNLRINPQNNAGKADLKRTYLMELEGDGAGKHPGAGQQRRAPKTMRSHMADDSEDEDGQTSGSDDKSDEEGSEESGSGAEGTGGEAGGQGSRVQAFDYASARKVEEEKQRRQRRALARAAAEMENAQQNRGRGRGRGRGGAAGGRGRGQQAGGARKPAFNPYAIPEENIIKGGKRSAVMPRSGNKTITFK